MDYLERSTLVSKLLLPAAVISSVGYGSYIYQNAQNSQQLQSDPKMIPFESLDYTPGDTEFDKLVEKDISYSNDTLSFGDSLTKLQASKESMSKLKRVAVGHAGLKDNNNLHVMLNHPNRPNVNWNDLSITMNYAGYTQYLSFYAFSEQIPGTKRVALGKSVIGQLMTYGAFLNHPDFDQSYWNNKKNRMDHKGWTGYGDFWAFDSAKPGSIRVAVGQRGSYTSRKDPHRMMLNHPSYSQNYWNNQKNPMNVLGYSHFYEFWAYPSDLEIEKLVYQLDKAQIVSQEPKGTMRQTLKNKSSLVQTQSVSFRFTKSESSSWSHSLGVGLLVTAGGKAGVPFLAEGKWEVSLDTTYDFTKEKTVTNTSTSTYDAPVDVAPWTRMESKCIIQEAKLVVPYVIKFKSKYGKIAHDLTGVWNGVNVGNVKCTYDEFPL